MLYAIYYGFPFFSHQFDLRMHCTPTFSILIDGVPYGFITLTRGLSQGDPFSPYLFYVAKEFFSLQMKDAFTFNYIQSISQVRPIISYLLYADDVMISLSATSSNANAMGNIFNQLASIVGLQINDMKSKVYFSKDVTNKTQLLNILGMSEDTLPVKYLVVPLSIDYIHAVDCVPLAAKVFDKFEG